ncbi:MAG: transposase, partial [Deltaproteobacteria bacterium]|nr:transposase [Deltaproteobacteria bacterium]
KELSGDPKHLGAEIGFIAILHTWTQTLIDHPHIHCIVPGGGLSSDRKVWIPCKNDFFIHVEVLSRKFRGKFLHYLRKAKDTGVLKFPGKIESFSKKANFENLLTDLYSQEWVVYCKPPFENPERVIDYLGRYTHRVAISNDRIVGLKEDRVTIRYRDSEGDGKVKFMTLEAFEFIRRFLLHILPDGFMKIRHYGILSNRNRRDKLPICKEILSPSGESKIPDAGEGANERGDKKENWEDLLFRITGVDPRVCPHCGKGKMLRREKLQPRRSRCPP